MDQLAAIIATVVAAAGLAPRLEPTPRDD